MCVLGTVSDSATRGLQPARLLCPWDSPGQNTGAACHFLLQGIVLTQGWNPGLPHCWQILYRLSHQGSPSNVGVPCELFLTTENLHSAGWDSGHVSPTIPTPPAAGRSQVASWAAVLPGGPRALGGWGEAGPGAALSGHLPKHTQGGASLGEEVARPGLSLQGVISTELSAAGTSWGSTDFPAAQCCCFCLTCCWGRWIQLKK